MHVRLPKMDRWPYVNVVALGALCYMLIFSLIGLFPLLARSFADDHEEDGRAHSFADGHEEDGIGFPPALYLAPCVRAAVVRTRSGLRDKLKPHMYGRLGLIQTVPTTLYDACC
jgi:hypothetical protein